MSGVVSGVHIAHLGYLKIGENSSQSKPAEMPSFVIIVEEVAMSNDNEHTSQGLSQRLHDKGFRGEHERFYATGKLGTLSKKYKGEYIGYIPAYTFTELWVIVGILKRPHLMKCLLDNIHRNDLAEVAGEWQLDSGHYDVDIKSEYDFSKGKRGAIVKKEVTG